jgi:glyoxylase-like metal-dependent hydrolase (beta-lactamase superfamily II)
VRFRPAILSTLPDIKELADRTYLLAARLTSERAMFSVYSVYLIDDGGGALVEPGPAALVPQIREGMEKLGMRGLSYILPTHIHMDHAGGTGALARLFPQAKVVVHPSGAKHFKDPARLTESTREVVGEDFEARFGAILPIPADQLHVAEDGEVLSLDGRKLKVVYSPGHAPHHLSYLDLKTRGLFCGEAVGVPEQGDEWPPLPYAAPPGFDLEAYLQTLEKLRALMPRTLFFSHRGTGYEPDKLLSIAQETAKAFGDIILDGLKAGAATKEISRRIRDYLHRRFGPAADIMDPSLVISGYEVYFRRKGLLSTGG